MTSVHNQHFLSPVYYAAEKYDHTALVNALNNAAVHIHPNDLKTLHDSILDYSIYCSSTMCIRAIMEWARKHNLVGMEFIHDTRHVFSAILSRNAECLAAVLDYWHGPNSRSLLLLGKLLAYCGEWHAGKKLLTCHFKTVYQCT